MDRGRAAAILSALRGPAPGLLTWEAVALRVRLAALEAAEAAAGEEESRRAEEAFLDYLEAAAAPGNRPPAGAEAAAARQSRPRPGLLRTSLEASLSVEIEKARRRAGELAARLGAIPDPAGQLSLGNALLTSLGSVREQQQAAEIQGRREVEVTLTIAPSGQAQPGAETEPAGAAGPGRVRLRLDAGEDPVAAAQRCFERYTDGRRAQQAVGGLLDEARNRLEYLEQLRFQLDSIPGELTAEDAEAITDGARRAGVRISGSAARTQRPGRPAADGPGRHPGKPLSLRSPGGIEVLVGRNNHENDRLLRLGTADDLWFHARGVPGAHVLLRRAGLAEIPDEDVYFAAAIAAGRSRASKDGTAPVDVVPLRLVRREKGAPPGFVRYSGETTIRVIPRAVSETATGGSGEPGETR
jgi:predicted ribosome quality control (RQC) complex YloA/Tae2 family protein